MTEKILSWAIPFICGGTISFLTTYAKMKKAKTKALEDGVQCLLRAEIIACHERYTSTGICPIYAKESLRRIYAAYHSLGGNDVATNLYEKVIDLPEKQA